MKKLFIGLCFIISCFSLENRQAIWLEFINQALKNQNEKIKELEDKILHFVKLGEEKEIPTLLAKLKDLKSKRQVTKRLIYVQSTKVESFAFWTQKTSSIQELIEEYGGFDGIWIIPVELGAIKINLSSQKPIPSALWPEILKQILIENGIGVQLLHAYVKQLYKMKNDASHIELFCDDINKLKLLGKETKVAFLQPFRIAEQRKLRFLETTAATHNIHLNVFEKQILIIGQAEKVVNFVQLLCFILEDNQQRHFEPVLLSQIKARQAKELLEMTLIDNTSKIPAMISVIGEGVKIFAVDEQDFLLILVGSQEEVEKVKKLIETLESKMKGSSEKVLYSYVCKHCNPEDAANVLTKIYPKLIQIQSTNLNLEKDSSNFIVESKSSSLMMVVEKSVLKKIQDVLKQIDQPKKMVRIEVLLFEKKTKNENRFGLKDLQLGSNASRKNQSGSRFRDGIFDFFLSKKTNQFAPFDLSYQFLLTNQDIQINACPTVTTVNSTTATISLTEEISVNTGAIFVDKKEEKSFKREKFGIVLKITPTINFSDDEQSEKGYITLNTDIEFDTINSNKDDRPDVSKRHIENQVRIADGETLIIGGLRRKDKEGASDKIPFLGEIPGIGKLFSRTNMNDNQTEMFIFITPHIIEDPSQYLKQTRRSELEKRPGDFPEFLKALKQARVKAKSKIFDKSLKLLFRTSESINE